MISRLIYTCLLHLLLPFILVRLWLRGRQTPAYRQRWQERLGNITPINDKTATNKTPLWIHAVSVGEVQAISILVQRIIQRHPDLPIIITTMTPTGADRVRQLFGQQVHHRFCPYDLPWAMKRFLKLIQPRACLIVETELWPNFLHQCHNAGVPVLLANARLSEKSARGYARFPALTKEMLNHLDQLAAQNETDAARFRDLGMNAKRLSVTGSIKFDVRIQPEWAVKAKALTQQWGNDRPVLLAASTHHNEEAELLNAFPELLRIYPNALLILVPRHPERFSEVAQLCQSTGLHYQRHSENTTITTTTHIYLGDTMGELMVFCAAASVVFIGGSLIERGGHNPLEPALLGRPVICGLHTFNFAEITRGLLDAGGLTQVPDADAVMQQSIHWFEHPDERQAAGTAAQHYVAQHAGALERLEGLLEKFI